MIEVKARRLDALKLRRAQGHSQHVLEPSTTRRDRSDGALERDFGDQHPGAAVAQHVLHLGRCEVA